MLGTTLFIFSILVVVVPLWIKGYFFRFFFWKFSWCRYIFYTSKAIHHLSFILGAGLFIFSILAVVVPLWLKG
jgi:hypothetical protein